MVTRRVRALVVAAASIVGTFAAMAPAHADLTAPDLPEAWVKSFGTKIGLASPVTADLTGDGVPEIIVAGHDGILRVLRADGSTLWEQPVTVTAGGPAVAVEASPTVADINGDGKPEIIVSAQSLSVPGQGGGAEAFDTAGNVLWRWAGGEDIFSVWYPSWGTRPDGYREGAVTSPVIGDVDGDGKPEVVIGALDNRVHVLRTSDGSELPGWSSRGLPGYWIDDSIFSVPVVFDGDGDGRAEIYLGVAASPGGSIDHAGGDFLALGWNGSGPVVKWQQFTGDVLNSSPALGDIDGDGRPELVVGAGYDYASRTSTPDARAIFAWHADDGSAVPGWPQYLNGVSLASVALGDLNNDGKLEVVAASDPRSPGGGAGGGEVWAFHGDGSVMWHVDPHQYVVPIKIWEGGGGFVDSPVIADVNGDGVNDVIAANPWATFIMNGRDGSRIFAPMRKGWINEGGAAVANFGGAGWRIVLQGWQSDTSSTVASITIAAPGVTPPWPQFRGGADHAGVASNALPQCPSLPSSGAPSTPTATYHPVTPNRIADTRTGLGVTRRALAARCGIAVGVVGVGGVPASGVSAVTVNVTVVNPSSSGFVVVYPCGIDHPASSNLNFVRGQTVANLVTVGVGVGGKVCLWTYAQSHIIVDMAGWFGDSGARLVAVAPKRLVDTRENSPGRAAAPVGAGQVLDVQLAGVSPLPSSGIAAVAVNLTAVQPTGDGYLTAYPCDAGVPSSSSVNYSTGQIVANHVVVPLSATGHLCVFTYATSDVLVDVMGYYTSAQLAGLGAGGVTKFLPISPDRFGDTRTANRRMTAGDTWRIHVAGVKAVPAGAVAVILNVTAVNPSAAGYLTVYPCGGATPNVSSVNYVPGYNVPNYVTVGIGEGGDVCVYSYAATDAIVDVSGYFA